MGKQGGFYMSAGSMVHNQDLKILVNELSKTNPNETVVKSKTGVLGIPYHSDVIILMSEVLVYLSKNNKVSKSKFKEKLA
jgi:hypothetical protein